MQIVMWCNVCNAEQAVATIEAEINEEWTTLDIGEKCLTRLREAGKIE